MNKDDFIALTMRYPAEHLIYVSRNAITAFGENMTDRGVIGSVIYTTGGQSFHVNEDPKTIYNLIQ